MALSFLMSQLSALYHRLLSLVKGGNTKRISPEVTKEIRKPTVFALIIGINDYEAIPKLSGAVADADAIEGYLKTNLGITESHIRTLRDKEATRARIIEEFQALAQDGRIEVGDPILIYYAGHGGSSGPPLGWETGGAGIQLILPCDYKRQVGRKVVNGIPDRTIGVLLANIAETKGDNITVVLDCCYSGSGTRQNALPSLRTIRGVDTSLPIPLDLDHKILLSSSAEHRASAIAPGFLHAGLRSHVLLAACGMNEAAQEENGRGLFTKAFVDTLLSVGANPVTYLDFIKRLPKLSGQNPQCEGVNQSRVMFNKRAPVSKQVAIRVHKTPIGEYEMDIGAAHGITEGAVFVLYGNGDASLPLATLVAREPSPFSTILDVELVDDGYVVQTRPGVEEDLQVFIAADSQFQDLFPLLAELTMPNSGGKWRIKVTESRIDAELAIGLEGDQVVFDMSPNGQDITHRLPHTIKYHTEDIYDIICAATHYFWHLRRASRGNLHKTVTIEFLRMKEEDEYDEDLMRIISPYGENMISDGVVNVYVDDDAMYGMRITNNSNTPLYCSVFFFDSDFSIVSYHQPGISGQNVDPSMKPHQSLGIGYGSGGIPPRVYFLQDEQDFDVGFVKVFLSTEAVDFSHIPQSSPFESRRKGKVVGTKNRIPSSCQWSTVIVPVKQWRGRHSPKL